MGVEWGFLDDGVSTAGAFRLLLQFMATTASEYLKGCSSDENENAYPPSRITESAEPAAVRVKVNFEWLKHVWPVAPLGRILVLW